MKLKIFLLILFFTFFLIKPVISADVAIVVNEMSGTAQKIVDGLKEKLNNHKIKIYEMKKSKISDSIKKGKLLVKISKADLVIPVLNEAALFVEEELEDSKCFFIGATKLSGEYLEFDNVSGIMPYSLKYLAETFKKFNNSAKGISVLYAPGYEDVIKNFEKLSGDLGLDISTFKIKKKKHIAKSIRKAVKKSDAVVLLGGKLLTKGAGFKMILKTTLLKKVALIAPSTNEVKKGALFCIEGLSTDLLTKSVDELTKILLTKKIKLPKTKILSGPDNGSILYSEKISGKLGLSIPSDIKGKSID